MKENSSRIIVDNYLKTRRKAIDVSEWYDILWALRGLGAKPRDFIVELGAGEGFLLDFLKMKGYKNVVGIDIRGDGKKVIRMDLERNYPPQADYYIFQHFIEHINQKRAIGLLKYCYSKGKAIIGILPGHFVNDESHIINHYEYEDVLSLVAKISPKFYVIRPDIASFANPAVRDWLLILSKKRISARQTFSFAGKVLLFGFKTYLKLLLRIKEKGLEGFLCAQ